MLLATRKRSTEKTKRIEELIHLRIEGELTKQTFAPLYQPLEHQLRQLEQSIPELEATIDFLRNQQLSSSVVFDNAKALYEQWPEFSFEEKRGIVEIITYQIVIGKEDIDITFSYRPHPISQNGGTGTQLLQDAGPFLHYRKRFSTCGGLDAIVVKTL